mmetsp:Transcript_55554/g.148159  ORF Transcript_55554/g.148159 Transcript_55554/m.148159 type:complete len:151 (+) Transcript_55554:74-526(+)
MKCPVFSRRTLHWSFRIAGNCLSPMLCGKIVMSQWFEFWGASAVTSVNEIEEHLLVVAGDAGSHVSLAIRHQLLKSSHRSYHKPWSPPLRCRRKEWHTTMCWSRPTHYMLEECRDHKQTFSNVLRELYSVSPFECLKVIIFSRTSFFVMR